MMKLITVCLIILTSVFARAGDLPADTTIKGVRIFFQYSPSIFPGNWHESPIDAKAEQLPVYEVRRSTSVIINALAKYPVRILRSNIKAVYFLKAMSFYGLTYGGTNSRDTLYLANRGDRLGYSDLYIEQTFHHEFSSVLYRNYPSFFDAHAWALAHDKNFLYNDPEEGNGAIRNNKSSQSLDTSLCRLGFLTQYSLSSLENDINTIAQNIFSPSKNFWKLVDEYPLIKKKVGILTDFYHKVDPLFTIDYFRKLNP